MNRDISGSNKIRAGSIEATRSMTLPKDSETAGVANMRYRTDTKKVQVHDGTSWTDVGNGGGGGEPPDYQDLKDVVNQHSTDITELEGRVDGHDTAISELDHAKDVAGKINVDEDNDTLVTDGNLTIENVEGGAAIYRLTSRSSPGASANGDWGIDAGTDNNGGLTLYNYETNRSRFLISRGGSVRIGTSPTTSSYKLHVDGTLRATGRVHFGANYNNSNANVALFTGTSTNDRVVIQGATGGNAVLRLISGYGSNVTSDWGWSANSSGHFGLYQYSNGTSGTWAMTASDEGDIGIGTQNPTAKLDVNGTTRLRGNVQADGNLTVDGRITSYSPSAEPMALFQANSGSTRRHIIENIGGGAAMYRLRTVSDDDVTHDWGISTRASSPGTLVFYNYDTNSHKMVMMSNGFVGIGNVGGTSPSTPTANLDVFGDMRVRGNLVVEGTYPGGGGGGGGIQTMTYSQSASQLHNTILTIPGSIRGFTGNLATVMDGELYYFPINMTTHQYFESLMSIKHESGDSYRILFDYEVKGGANHGNVHLTIHYSA